MNPEERIQDYIKLQTTGWLEEDLPVLKKEFCVHREKFVESLATAIGQLCTQGRVQQEAGEKGPAAYLCISLQRTHILENNWCYRLDLYDDGFYLDRTECSVDWDLEFVWDALKKRLENLNGIIRKGIYANKIRPYHLNQVKLKMAVQYHEAARNFTQQIIQEAFKADIAKAPAFLVLMGEYNDYSMQIYEERNE